MATVHTIPITVHGRYLVAPAAGRPEYALVGCHGYAENADIHLDRLSAIAGADRCTLVSVQGLHRFYNRRSQSVVASWMTRQDRDLAIADNVSYINGVLEAVLGDDLATPLVFTGFSQGVAMAYRAACRTVRQVAAVVSLGGDVPPELTADALARVPRALVGRGTLDEWYTAEKHHGDLERLQAAGVRATPFALDGGHEWPATFSAEIARFLQLAT